MDSYYKESKDDSNLSKRVFSLKWTDFENQLLLSFSNLYLTKDFTDMTLVCEGNSIDVIKSCWVCLVRILDKFSR